MIRKKLALSLVVAFSAGLAGGAPPALASPHDDKDASIIVVGGKSGPGASFSGHGWDHGSIPA